MTWIAPSEKDTANAALEKRLWAAAEQTVPAPHFAEADRNHARPEGLLGLILLRFAEVRFAARHAQLESPSPLGGERAGVRGDSGHRRPSDGRGTWGEGAAHVSRRGSRVDEPAAYHAEGILYLAAEARFDYLLNRPEAENIGAKVNVAMRDVAKFEVRVAKSELPSVRHSSFDIRTSRQRKPHEATMIDLFAIRPSDFATFDSRTSSFGIPQPRTTPRAAWTSSSPTRRSMSTPWTTS